MSKYMVSADEVKNALGIENFRNMSKDKIMEFVSAIPNMDKDVALEIINKFPAYIEFATNMIAQLNETCDKVLEKNDVSQKESIEAYKMILSDLGELLKNDGITPEERAIITDKMISVADRVAAKDTENKEFLGNLIKCSASVIGGVLFLGAVILGVNVKGTKIPILKK